MDGDPLVLEKLLSDDLIYTHSSGVVDDKTAFLARVQSGLYRRLEQKNVDVRARGHTAIVTGLAEIETQAQGKRKALVVRFVNIWIHSDSGWQNMLWQATVVPAQGA